MKKIALLILLSLLCHPLSAQHRMWEVSGTVTDNSGEAVIGASVVIVGTTQGCITDLEGQYRIMVSQDDVLRVSFIGMSDVDVSVNGRHIIDVELEEEIYDLGIPGPPYGRSRNFSATLGGSYGNRAVGYSADFIIYLGHTLPRTFFAKAINYIDIGLRIADIRQGGEAVVINPFYHFRPNFLLAEIFTLSTTLHKVLGWLPYVEIGYYLNTDLWSVYEKGWNFGVGLRPCSFKVGRNILLVPKVGYSMFVKDSGRNFIHAGLEIKMYRPLILY